MSDTPLAQIVPDFHEMSFMAGTNIAFSDAVGAGLKRLALSSPYSPEQLDIMIEVTKYTSERCGTVTQLEPNLIETILFPRDVARGKTVILIAKDHSVFEEYAELKRMKAESDTKNNPEDLELEIAQKFGKLLSYDDEKITGYISQFSES